MINLNEYGYNEDFKIQNKELIPARIIEVHRNLYKIMCKFGETSATIKGTLLKDFQIVKQLIQKQRKPNRNQSINIIKSIKGKGR